MADKTKVWDLPVRLFHWMLALTVALLWVSGEFGGLSVSFEVSGFDSIYWSNMDVHAALGQWVLVLVLFRILWGFAGSSTARFAQFLRGPRFIWQETRALLRGETPQTLGHNPLGAVMIVAMLTLLLLQSVTGLFAQDDFVFSGPLADRVDVETSKWLTGWHHRTFGLIQGLIILHIAAIAYYLLRGKNLVGAMLSGLKALPDTPPDVVQSLYFASRRRALALLILAGLAVMLAIYL